LPARTTIRKVAFAPDFHKTAFHSMKAPTSRRQFLKSNLGVACALATVPSIIPATVLGRAGAVTPANRIQVGCIGVGPQGRGVMGNFLGQADARVVAVCDVSQPNLDQAAQQVNRHSQDACRTYRDFRELLARDDIDAVLIATPDQWHVPIAIAAARAGKDMYLEKPMGLTVSEDQALRQVLEKEGRIFQFGTQQRSSAQFRQACELVRNGRIGQLKQIDVWCNASRPGGSTTPAPVPDTIDYEFWLGPARYTPYTVDKCYDDAGPGMWKTWWHNYDYALGFIAGWGVHPLDIAYWGHPAIMNGQLDVAGRGLFPDSGACNTAIAWDVQFTCADGVRMAYRGTRNGFDEVTELNDMRPWEKKYGHIIDHGTAFEGTDGWVIVDRSQIRTHPDTLVEYRAGDRDLQLPRSSNHVRDFLMPFDLAARAFVPSMNPFRPTFFVTSATSLHAWIATLPGIRRANNSCRIPRPIRN
jgi:predicted dehydrogenase